MAVQPAIRSAVPGQIWPAIVSPLDAELLALQYQLEKSQWFAPQVLADLQLQQASALLKHAISTVPFYQEHLSAHMPTGDKPLDWDAWRAIPPLEKKDLQRFNDQFISNAIPPAHLPLTAGMTSCSTTPVHTMKTRVTSLMWMACVLRDLIWHDNDTSAKLAAIKYFDDPNTRTADGAKLAGWGLSTDMLLPAGNAVMLDIRHTLEDQLQWLAHQQPDYLLSYPSNLAALAEACIASPIKLNNLRSLSTLGEVLTPRHRQLFRQAWGVEVNDVYSAEEVGFMAVQCPTGEHYHVQSEHVIVEVVDENGQPCKPGEIGRVLVTSLNNFAKPHIRYVVGDYAEVGPACACGRGLPVINKIMGRTRNMFMRPDGQVFWPTSPVVDAIIAAQMPKVRRSQYVQKALDWIEVRVQTENESYSPEMEQVITKTLQKDYGYPFRITFAYPATLPSPGRSKYEEFTSELVT